MNTPAPLTRHRAVTIAMCLAGLALLALAGAIAGGCSGAGQRASWSARDSAQPAPRRSPHTTDGRVYLRALDARIAHLESQVAAQPGRIPLAAGLVGLWLQRAELTGRVSDYDRAEALAERIGAAAPRDVDAILVRAQVRGRLHRFAAAAADIFTARALGARGGRVDALRASVLLATGGTQQALAIYRDTARRWPSEANLGALAAALSRTGHSAEAARVFARARAAYHDVSPVPPAWLDFQEGLLRQKAGQFQAARDLLARAVARLPGYAPATAHLAGVMTQLGQGVRAARTLAPLVARAEDPEYPGDLGLIDLEIGRSAEGARLLARSRAGYRRLLSRHRAAFSAHAARIWAAQAALVPRN